jgi:hypothetical protein
MKAQSSANQVAHSRLGKVLMDVTCHVSYASSEGKANGRVPDFEKLCQTWMTDMGNSSSVCAMTRHWSYGHRHVLENAIQGGLARHDDGKAQRSMIAQMRICVLREDWSFRITWRKTHNID